MTKKLTIIIPSYNEEKNIRPFYEETSQYLKAPGYEFQFLFVNDGSRDNTIGEIKKLAAEDPRVKFLSFSRNFGKESAMHAGLSFAKGSDAVILIDCDLQQPPSLIPEMIQYYEEGYKIVYTKGRTRKGEPKLRTVFANLYYKMYNRYTDRPLENGAKDFQLIDRQVVEAILSLKDNLRFMKGLFSWVGFKKKCLEYDFIPRRIGKSSWSFKSLFKYGFNGMNQFSTILMVLPWLAFWLGLALLAGNIALFAVDVFSLSVFLLALELNVMFLILDVCLYGVFYLLYSVRRQALDRPIYLVEEASEDI
ncbi:MAG TPA: glycosyltransferase family 2 protein [Candidatus Izemoplasmatales bacterium]|nr:glycosyltransferase family 2 protein [Bacillota bacterium]HRY77230.1 glycosyltransferase family 2 protein [Candidatus Izemoplasmatales bacterium]